MKDFDNYRSYEFDNLTEGSKIKVERSIYVDETDMSDLISKPIGEICVMREESVKKETSAFEKAQQAAQEWEKQAAVTRQLDMAIEYLKTPEAQHTSNKWVKGKNDYDFTTISNKVYTMSYRLREGYSWRGKPAKWEIQWRLTTNSPRQNYNKQIAGQDKSYSTKEEAEKYLQGRIKAYSHLFTEISPPIPEEYTSPFKLHGQLLPGYTVEGEPKQEQENSKSDKKPSIRKELNSIKASEKSAPKPQAKTRDNPEL